MNVICHQGVSPNAQSRLDDLVEKDSEVCPPIGFVPIENTLPVASVSYVMRHSRNDDSRQFGHKLWVLEFGGWVVRPVFAFVANSYRVD
jgi:hypothetical protein